MPRGKVDPERVSRGLYQQGRLLARLRTVAAIRKRADNEMRRLAELARDAGVDEAVIRRAAKV